MLTIEVFDARLIVRLSGWDRVWALKRELSVPVEHVESIAYEPEFVARFNPGLRLPGTALPGVIVAGSYWWKDRGWSFYSMRKAERTIVVRLREERYQRLILQSDEPEATARRLRDELARYR